MRDRWCLGLCPKSAVVWGGDWQWRLVDELLDGDIYLRRQQAVASVKRKTYFSMHPCGNSLSVEEPWWLA